MRDALPRIALTSGEPAGIGPDICAKLAQAAHPVDLVVLGDPELLTARAKALGLPLHVDTAWEKRGPAQGSGHMRVLPLKLRKPSEAGRVDPVNAPYVIEM